MTDRFRVRQLTRQNFDARGKADASV